MCYNVWFDLIVVCNFIVCVLVVSCLTFVGLVVGCFDSLEAVCFLVKGL